MSDVVLEWHGVQVSKIVSAT